MKEIVAEHKKNIRAVMGWQLFFSLSAALIGIVFFGNGLDILFGSALVILSTWHVHQSVYGSHGDRLVLIKLAGLRFVVFLILLGLGVIWLEVQPLFVVVGMTVSYVAMYVKSLLMIFEKLKGS